MIILRTHRQGSKLDGTSAFRVTNMVRSTYELGRLRIVGILQLCFIFQYYYYYDYYSLFKMLILWTQKI